MKVLDIILTYKQDNIETVICKSDGEIKYCNALSVNGTCCVKDCTCPLAVAVIVKLNYGIRQYLAVEH